MTSQQQIETLFIVLNVRGHTHTHIHIKDVLMADMMRVRFTLISHIAHQLCKKKNINITLTLVSIFFSWAFSPQFVKAHVKNNSFGDDKRKIFLPTNSHHDCIYQDLCNATKWPLMYALGKRIICLILTLGLHRSDVLFIFYTIPISKISALAKSL